MDQLKFLAIAATEPHRVKVVDAMPAIAVVHEEIWRQVSERLK